MISVSRQTLSVIAVLVLLATSVAPVTAAPPGDTGDTSDSSSGMESVNNWSASELEKSIDGDVNLDMSTSTAFNEENLVVVAGGGDLYAFERDSGDLAWNYTTSSWISTDPVADGGNVYITDDEGVLHSVGAEQGIKRWSYKTSSTLYDAPEVGSDRVYVGSASSKIYAFDKDDGTLVWNTTLNNSHGTYHPPTVQGDTVYVGTDANEENLFALESSTGVERWNFSANGGLSDASPVVSEGVVYVITMNEYAQAVDADTGTELWNYNTGNDMDDGVGLIVRSGRLYFGGNDGNLIALDKSTGNKAWSYSITDTTGDRVSTPAYDNGVLYFSSNDGRLYSVDDESADGTERENWNTSINTNAETSPVVKDGTVYVGVADYEVASVDTETGNLLDTFAMSGTGDTWSSPTLATSNYLDDGTAVIRNETDGTIINASNVTATFYGQDDTVFSRDISNATIDLSTLPDNERFVVEVTADGYLARTVTVDQALSEQAIYLLGVNDSAVLVDFSIEDETGQFQGDDTAIVVEKAIEQDNTTEYRHAAGDFISATGEVSVYLQRDRRYRLSVVSDTQTRRLGSYRATAPADETIPIGVVAIGGGGDTGAVFRATTRSSSSQDYIRLAYVDQEELTDSLDVTIYRVENGTETQVATRSVTGPLGTYTELVAINNTANNYRVEWSADRDGETIGGDTRVGEVASIADNWPIADWVLEMLGMIMVVGVGGLLVIYDSSLSGIGMVAVATLLTAIGVISLPMWTLAPAAAAAILFQVGTAGGSPI